MDKPTTIAFANEAAKNPYQHLNPTFEKAYQKSNQEKLKQNHKPLHSTTASPRSVASKQTTKPAFLDEQPEEPPRQTKSSKRRASKRSRDEDFNNSLLQITAPKNHNTKQR